ncbi:MAG: Ig-like domain-containing protein [Gemmatimonadaceae bacterium]
MRYRRACVLLLLVCVACGGGDTAVSPLSTAPGSLATVQINASTNTIAVGQTTTITAAGLDESGDTVAGTTTTWQTLNAAIATVSSAGLVAGIAQGSTVITATIGARAAQTTIVVVPAVSTSCASVTPLALTIGGVHTLTASERATLCVGGGAAGSEYVLVPFKSDTISAHVSVSLTALGTVATTGAPSAQIARSAAIPSFGARPSSVASSGEFGAAFEHTLRETERRVLSPLVAAAARGGVMRSMQRAAASRSAILNLPTTPAVGTYFHLNANGVDACTNAQVHTARVAAVSNSAIVAVDSQAPTGGFTDTDYASFATTFDTLIFALDTSAYGAPMDIDGNGRVLIFFTQAVNKLTPPGSNGYIGGFFFSRDLFPTTGVAACPTSNVGEMFYVPVVDPAGLYNKFFMHKDSVQIELYGTLAHEFQHLINASRRLAVSTSTSFEVVWLNEGMSHIAEELLYFRESGFTPKSGITLAAVRSSQAEIDAVNNYQFQNLLRLDYYLKAPGVNSPYAPNDSLATRGATYQLLRYALDESSGPNSSYLHALINTPNTGVVNFNTVFAGTFPNIFTAVQQQVLANFFGGSGIAVDPKYSFPSWDYRDVIGNGLLQVHANPLQMIALSGVSSNTTVALTGGGSAYARFGIAANGTAAITSASGGNAVPSNVAMLLVRTH